MRTAPLALLALFGSALAGCFVSVDPGPDPYPYGGGGTTTGGGYYQHHDGAGGGLPSTATPTYRILPGAPSAIATGTQPGFAIAANVGGSYRLVWTGDGDVSGAYREFYGSIYTPGRFTSVAAGCAQASCALESGGYVSAPVGASGGGSRIDFDTVAANRVDGFDFTVDTEPVYFDLFIDGRRYPQLVYFPATDNGGAVSNVGAIPFGLVTQ